MNATKKAPRNLTVLEVDRDLAKIIVDVAKRHNLKIYRLTSDVVRAGLKVKRLLPSLVEPKEEEPKAQL